MSNKYPGGFISLGGPESYSNYFNGSNKLNTASNAALALGSGDFTIEFWVYLPVYAGNRVLSWGTTSAPIIYFASGYLYYDAYGGANIAQSTIIAPLGAWTHCAISRSSGTTKLFINGIQGASVSDANNWSGQAGIYIGVDINTTYLTGFLSNLRVVKGTALYTANFTPPTGPLQNITNTLLLTCQSSTIVDNSSNAWTLTNTGGVTVSSSTPLQAYNPNTLNPALGAATNGVWTLDQALNAEISRSWPMYDPYYNNVVLNLHGNGTNGAQNNTFLDSSSNNFTITRNGNTTQGAFNPYRQNGYWSNYFTGAGNNYLKAPASSNLSFGTGDFTIEFWINTSNFSTSYYDRRIFSTGANSSTGLQILFPNANTITVLIDPSTILITGTTVVANGSWHHVAVTRSSNSMKLFVDGVQTGSTATVTNNFTDAATNGIYISAYGGDTTNSGGIDGYLSNYRIIKGTALYTSNFTPSTTPLTAVSGTQLLTCQSNRFIDNSSNAFSMTVGSTAPSVQTFTPLLQNLPYESSRLGGSGYFDGSGDNLTCTQPSLNATFTIEAWIYRTSGSANQAIVHLNSGSYGGVIVYIDTSNYLTVTDGVNGQSPFSNLTVPINAWTHIAVVRSGGTTTGYVNGIVAGSNSFTPATVNSANIGAYVGSLYFPGYISDVRVVNGSAVYSSAFTPPTAPLTAITNTSLLLNTTNAGIFDNATMNNWETVGNAQISTSTKKYGTGAMYFDGNDYLTAPSNSVFAIGANEDYTMECWVNFTVVQDGAFYQATNNPSAANGQLWFGYEGGALKSSKHGSGTYAVSYTWSPSTGTWYHVAATRASGTVRLFINGTVVTTNTTTQNGISFTQSGAAVGVLASPSYFYGYIDDLRVTKGVARYLGNFQPPTSQLQDQ